MDKKKLGVILLIALLVALFIYNAVVTMQMQTLKKENKTVAATIDSTNEYQERIDTIHSDLMDAQKKLQAVQQNNAEVVLSAAEYFLTVFYDNDNCTEQEQLDKIKSLVDDEVYQLLLPEEIADSSQTYMQDLFYKTWVTDIQSYYRFTNETTADIFIYCVLHVQSGNNVNTSSPLIFSATMTFRDGQWIISQIGENRTIRTEY